MPRDIRRRAVRGTRAFGYPSIHTYGSKGTVGVAVGVAVCVAMCVAMCVADGIKGTGLTHSRCNTL